jgi:hypothetical protein
MMIPQQDQRVGRMADAQATTESGVNLRKEARQLPSISASSRPRVVLTVEPDFDRTTEFLRWLIGEARAWEQSEKDKDIAAA